MHVKMLRVTKRVLTQGKSSFRRKAATPRRCSTPRFAALNRCFKWHLPHMIITLLTAIRIPIVLSRARGIGFLPAPWVLTPLVNSWIIVIIEFSIALDLTPPFLSKTKWAEHSMSCEGSLVVAATATAHCTRLPSLALRLLKRVGVP